MYIPFDVRFKAHCFHSVYRHSGVNKKVTGFFLCVCVCFFLCFFFFFCCFVFLYAVFMIVLIRKLSGFLFVRCVYFSISAFHVVSGLDNIGPKRA